MENKRYPVVEYLEPSPEQLEPILAREKDIVVDAGAGSGKTRTLTARYISLLEDGYQLRSIAAVTFTKKAAREMRNRIRRIISQVVNSSDLIQDDKDRWQSIYSVLDSARIGTIHSLAAEIIRNHPAEIGVDPRFELIDETDAVIMQADAVQAGLNWAARSQDASSLLVEIGEWRLRQYLKSMLGFRLEIRSYLGQSPAEVWKNWHAYLVKPICDYVNNPEVQISFNELRQLRESKIFSEAADKGDAFVPHLEIIMEQWEVLQSAFKEKEWGGAFGAINRLNENLKQKGRKSNWGKRDPKEIVSELQKISDTILGELNGINLNFDLDQRIARETIPALLDVFEFTEAYYQEQKSNRQVLDFDDLESMTLELLEGNQQVRELWTGKIRAILVDEFQDTNDRQRRIIKILSGDDKNLFIVGDGKQSIYRFRGADVSVFRDERRKVSREGKYYQLSKTYRTHAGLIENFNHLLNQVLGEESTENYIEPFSPLKPEREKPDFGIDAPFIEFHLSIGRKSEGAMSVAAKAVGQRLIEMVEPIRGKGRQLNFGDVAVLCRASGSFKAYENAFEDLDIPYTTVAGRGFYKRPEVRDILNSLSAFANPGDDLAVAGFLRSPVIGFSDNELLRIRRFQKEQKLERLYDALLQFKHPQQETSSKRVEWAIEVFEDIESLVGRFSAAEVLKRYLVKTHYLALLNLGGQYRAAENIRKLLESVQTSGLISIDICLEHIEDIRSSSAREGEAQEISAGTVQIMSVHQAKGLEFPVVVLGDASRIARGASGVLVQEPFGVVIPFQDENVWINENNEIERSRFQSGIYHLAAVEDKLRDEAESKRLLYVAATRARDKLLISGVIGGIAKNGKLYSPQGWLSDLGQPLGLDKLEIKYNPRGETIHDFTLDCNGSDILASFYELNVTFPGRREMNDGKIKSAGQIQEAMLNPLPQKRNLEEPQILERIWPIKTDFVPAWMIGMLVHRSLELWRFPQPGAGGDYAGWAGRFLNSKGVSHPGQVRRAIRQAEKLLDGFLSHKLYSIMEDADRRLAEIPFSWLDENQVMHQGVIDALFLYHGKWYLVDFKTDHVSDPKGIDL